MTLGTKFEREIRDQPDVWERLTESRAAATLAQSLEGKIVFVGSGSSFHAAQIGALALRRRGRDAHALAATESQADRNAYQGCVAVALSQSGRSSDLLAALDDLHPRRIVTLTNTVDSPLAQRADVVIDIGAGPEEAVPATKSVTSTVAIMLWAASILAGNHSRDKDVLVTVARATREWLASAEVERAAHVAQELAARRDVFFLGTDYGAFVAREAALKFKEAAYVHAEGFAAGEFRHGSVAVVDERAAVIGFVDSDGRDVVANPLLVATRQGALSYAIGDQDIDGVPRLGPVIDMAYSTLGWLVCAQILALHVARVRGIDSDAPRGLTKSITAERR